MVSLINNNIDTYTLHEEYRLIERQETEVNGAWTGAHLLLFFLAFVFGSFCTFCFHMLMYLFDEKCVLFPKLLSLTSLRPNVIYELMPNTKNNQEYIPVDFLNTQWVEKSTCDLPTYVPLVSGIFGLVWTTMFLMISTGSPTSGFHRPWRVLPPVFLFSLTMGILCTYSTTITHYGLQDLCNKLAEITGSSTCSYTVNAATLAYERSIRGVYQATRLTILTAWLHTACWILSAILAIVRVLLVVDFQLVKIHVDLRGDTDRMLQHHEQHIRTVSPDTDAGTADRLRSLHSQSNIKVHFKSKSQLRLGKPRKSKQPGAHDSSCDILFVSGKKSDTSVMSLVPPAKKITKTKKKISSSNILFRSSSALFKSIKAVIKKHKREKLSTRTNKMSTSTQSQSPSAKSDDELAMNIRRDIYQNLDTYIDETKTTDIERSSTSRTADKNQETHLNDQPTPIIQDEDLDETKKSNLKLTTAQASKKEARVKIAEPTVTYTTYSDLDVSAKSSDGTVEAKTNIKQTTAVEQRERKVEIHSGQETPDEDKIKKDDNESLTSETVKEDVVEKPLQSTTKEFEMIYPKTVDKPRESDHIAVDDTDSLDKKDVEERESKDKQVQTRPKEKQD